MQINDRKVSKLNITFEGYTGISHYPIGNMIICIDENNSSDITINQKVIDDYQIKMAEESVKFFEEKLDEVRKKLLDYYRGSD